MARRKSDLRECRMDIDAHGKRISRPRIKGDRVRDQAQRQEDCSLRDAGYGLCRSVSRACDLWLLRRGIEPEPPGWWTRRIDYVGEVTDEIRATKQITA
jgi:hypothetical protein